MKSSFRGLIIGLTLIATTGFDSIDYWKALNNRTWRSETFAGREIIFYETANGLRKAILQIHGSGVPLAGALIFDAEIDKKSAVLRDGMDLIKRDEQVMEPILLTLISDSVLMFDNNIYKKKADSLITLNWQSKIGQVEFLDTELLKSTSLDKKSIYNKECFKK